MIKKSLYDLKVELSELIERNELKNKDNPVKYNFVNKIINSLSDIIEFAENGGNLQ